MPSFAYRAVDGGGRRVRGTLEAATGPAAERLLAGQGMLVLAVDRSEEQRSGLELRRGNRRGVLEVTRALAALLPAGMPVARSLAACRHVSRGGVAEALEGVKARVERGESLAGALAGYPWFFSPLYIGLVRAGERSGDVAGAFRRLAIQLEREDEVRSRLLSASIYPLLLAAGGGAALIVLLLFVLPRFVELLQGTGAVLPRSTALLLSFSASMARGWPLLLVLGTSGVVALGFALRSDPGRRGAAWLLLALPLVGALRRNAVAARFARLTGVLLGGGAPLLSALGDVADGLADPLAREDVLGIRERVRQGVSLRQAIVDRPLSPPLLGQLVAVGEDSGRLEEFLLKAADILEDRTQRALERLVALAEPAMIVVFGVLVGFVALSLLQAIYGVNAASFR